MYNGIGLQTARGSGTNGYVTKNFAALRKRDKRPTTEEPRVDQANRQPNKEILAHARKRKIELKCLEFADVLEQQGFTQDEIEAKIESYRATLKLNDKEEQETENLRRDVNLDTHHLAEANLKKNNLLREAFGISQDFVEGTSLDPERREREAQLKALLQKKYQWVRTPSPSDRVVSGSEEKDKPKKEKKSKKQKKKSSGEKKNKKANKSKKSTADPPSDSDASDDPSSDHNGDENSMREKKSKKSKKESKKKKRDKSSTKNGKKSDNTLDRKDQSKKRNESVELYSSNDSAGKVLDRKHRRRSSSASASKNAKHRSESKRPLSDRKVEKSPDSKRKRKRRDDRKDSEGALSDEEFKSQEIRFDSKRDRQDGHRRSRNPKGSDSDYSEKNVGKSKGYKEKGKRLSPEQKNQRKSRRDRSDSVSDRRDAEKPSSKGKEREKRSRDNFLENNRPLREVRENKSPSPKEKYSDFNEDPVVTNLRESAADYEEDRAMDKIIKETSTYAKDSWIIDNINGRDVVRKVNDSQQSYAKENIVSEEPRKSAERYKKDRHIDIEEREEKIYASDKHDKEKSESSSSSSDDSSSEDSSDSDEEKRHKSYDKKKRGSPSQFKSKSDTKRKDSSSESISSDTSDSSDEFDIEPRVKKSKTT